MENCIIVMLPTTKASGIGGIYKKVERHNHIGSEDSVGEICINKNPGVNASNSHYEAQHLYAISAETCIYSRKPGGYYYNHITHKIKVWDGEHGVGFRKVEASTDDSLGLGTISLKFKKYFVERYNLGNCIPSNLFYLSGRYTSNQLKESWDKDEVSKLLHLALATGSGYGDKMDSPTADSIVNDYLTDPMYLK